ncbi:MAG: hypothetical protein ACLSVD_04890 [Eggerthellaceae bacterium]
MAVVLTFAASMSEVRAAQPSSLLRSSHGHRGVDELSEAIESMGEEVAMTASRLSRILRLSDRGIAPSSTATNRCHHLYRRVLRHVVDAGTS